FCRPLRKLNWIRARSAPHTNINDLDATALYRRLAKVRCNHSEKMAGDCFLLAVNSGGKHNFSRFQLSTVKSHPQIADRGLLGVLAYAFQRIVLRWPTIVVPLAHRSEHETHAAGPALELGYVVRGFLVRLPFFCVGVSLDCFLKRKPKFLSHVCPGLLSGNSGHAIGENFSSDSPKCRQVPGRRKWPLPLGTPDWARSS